MQADTRRLNLIGYRVEVKRSSNLALEGETGVVVDETKNTLLLEKGSGRIIRVPKLPCLFEVDMGNDKEILVDGKTILGRLDRRLTGR